MKILDDVKKHRSEIHTDMYSVSWAELLNWYWDGELNIDPEYQRLFRWSALQQSRLIESILLDIPLPPIFLAENEDSKHEVIDGLQRMSTVIKFFANPEKRTFSNKIEIDAINDINIPLTLTPGPLVTTLGGYTAHTLPESLSLSIKKSRVPVVFLKKESSRKTRYEVFKRVNTYGAQLAPQEIRNCTARILGHDFPNRLSAVSASRAVISAMGLPPQKVIRKSGEEMVLRLLALVHSPEPLTHNIEQHLDDFMEYAAEGKFKLTDQVVKKLERTFELISAVAPDGEAFKFERNGKAVGAFSTNLFDCVAVGVYTHEEKLSASKLRSILKRLAKSQELRAFVGAGSNTRKKISGRIEFGKEFFSKNL